LADVQELALGLAAVRRSVEQLTGQLAASQRQVGGDIANLQADEQDILQKLSATPPRAIAGPARPGGTAGFTIAAGALSYRELEFSA
jgi:hypothetical protein